MSARSRASLPRRVGSYLAEAIESYVYFWVFVFALCGSLTAGYYLLGWVGALLGLLVFVVGSLWVLASKNTARHRQYIAYLATQRQGENLQTFQLALADPALDSRVVQAVYTLLQQHLSFPIRPTDNLETIGADWVLEYDEVLAKMADDSGCSVEKVHDNPYCEHLTTPEMLIRFLCAQPRLPT